MGKKGGAVKGPSKVRGDSAYYRAIRAKRTQRELAIAHCIDAHHPGCDDERTCDICRKWKEYTA